MEGARISLRLEPEGHYVALDTFASALGNLHHLLHSLQVAVPGQAVNWIVTDLKIGSAYTVIEPVGDPQAGLTISMLAINGLEAMERLEVPALFPQESIEAARRLAEISTKAKIRTFISGFSRQLELTSRTITTAQEFFGTIWEDMGTIEGTLEIISVQSGYLFAIYDAISQKRIECHFKSEQLDRIKAALGRRVLVTGSIRYNRRGETLSVRVDEVNIIAEDQTLPSVEKMAGLAPEITDGLSITEYLRRLRDEH